MANFIATFFCSGTTSYFYLSCFHFSVKAGLLARMSAGQSVWDKLFRLVLALLVVAGLMAVVLWYQPVIQENQRLRRDKLELEKKIDRETDVARKLDADFRALQNPATIERLARERLSYAKPGEIVIHFDPPPANRQTQ
jgi:cell division protein FtsB